MKPIFHLIMPFCLSLLSVSAAPAKPNFLFIIVDDQSPFDLKAYDPDSILETPNIIDRGTLLLQFMLKEIQMLEIKNEIQK